MKRTGVPRLLPKDILDTFDLPSDCGLIAAAAFAYLDRHGVAARILYVRYGKDDGHCIVVFESQGRLHTFDSAGTLRFDATATWRTSSRVLARAWAKANGVKKRVAGAKWFKTKEQPV